MQPDFSTLIHTKSPEETQNWAAEWAKKKEFNKKSAQLWLLVGDLGSGKTTFVKGFAQAHGLNPDRIQSPTFALMKEQGPLVHYDLYRLSGTDFLLLEQMEEQLDQGKILLVEWPERFPELKARPHIQLSFKTLDEKERELSLHLYEPPSSPQES